MLASNIKLDKIRLPIIGSLKLEGVRGEFTPEGLFTRPMKRFNNKLVEEKFSILLEYCSDQNIIIEGEFYVHGIEFSDISSICRRAAHLYTELLEFHIFDMYDPLLPDMPFARRASIIECIVQEIKLTDVFAIEQKMYYTHKSIENAYASALDLEYEGFVLKHPDHAYKKGRSTTKEQTFVRMKQENTYDGVVIAIEERMENLCESKPNELGYMSKVQDKDQKAHTGLAAVAVVKCKEFDQLIRVTLSRGIKDYDETKKSPSRSYLWQCREDFVGKHIRWVGIPVKGMVPRSPRFDDWRTDLD